MKLILADYISSLKEDRELDLLATNLLRELDIIPLTTPQKGRQFGVDIAAVGPDPDSDQGETLFLIAVKQGNITRSNWSTEKTGVRATLEDIKDVYLNTSIPDQFKNTPKKIIVLSNGYIEQNVNINWVNYTNANTNAGIIYEYWGIDKLVSLAEKTQFSETLFPDEVRSLLRKSLALLDLPEYDYRHFYQLLDKIFLVEAEISKKETIKKIRLINSCLAIVYNWAVGYNNCKPPVIISERVIITSWNWIQHTPFDKDVEVIQEFLAIVKNKSAIDYSYFVKIKDALLVEDGLSHTGHMDHIEYCLLTFEQIGFISIMGLSKLWFTEVGMYQKDELFELSKGQFAEAEVIADYLCKLIDNNPSSLYPKFDEHCIEINLALILLYETGRFETAVRWLGGLVNYLSLNYSLYGFFPLWITDYEKLIPLNHTKDKEEPDSSILAVVLAEWCLIFKQDAMYHNLRYIITDLIKKVNLQLWKPDKETEQLFYSQNAMYDSGESKVSIKLYKNYREYLMEMTEERELWTDEFKMSCIKNGMLFIGYMAFRHYRTYVFPSLWRRFLNSPFCFNPKIEPEI